MCFKNPNISLYEIDWLLTTALGREKMTCMIPDFDIC